MDETVRELLIFYAGGSLVVLVFVMDAIKDHDEAFDFDCLMLVLVWPYALWILTGRQEEE